MDLPFLLVRLLQEFYGIEDDNFGFKYLSKINLHMTFFEVKVVDVARGRVMLFALLPYSPFRILKQHFLRARYRDIRDERNVDCQYSRWRERFYSPHMNHLSNSDFSNTHTHLLPDYIRSIDISKLPYREPLIYHGPRIVEDYDTLLSLDRDLDFVYVLCNFCRQ